MAAGLALGVLQVVVPVAIEAIEGLCRLITSGIKKRKERRLLVEEGLKDSINELAYKLIFFKSLSIGAADNQDQGTALQVWLEKLKETLLDAEDLLDEYATDLAVREMETELESRDSADAAPIESARKGKWKAKVSEALKYCFCIKHTGSSAHGIGLVAGESVVLANRVKDIIDSFVELRNNAGLLVLENPNPGTKSNLEWRQTTSTPEGYPMVGRDDDMKKIKQALLQVCGLDREEKVDGTSYSSSSSTNENQKPCLHIIPIVGMGGMGKTTLARRVFNDHELERLFDLRAWVCVSDDFEKSSILKRMIDSIHHREGREKAFPWTGLEELETEFRKVVQGKMVLLVLDDIWNEERVKWESLVTPLQAAARKTQGCAILITSRILQINRSITGCMEPINLQGLGEIDLWTVFERYAFNDYREEPAGEDHRQSLETIGRGICNKLQGSPLAAKSIGTLLATNHSVKHWNDVAGSPLWAVANNPPDIIPILTLSYQHLDAALKHCVIYLSLFPKDYRFRCSEIVQLWMAHNCIQQRRQGSMQEAVEDIGGKILEYLVGSSFLECDGTTGWYTMHDLMHDTIQSVSAHDCCLLEDGGSKKRQVTRTGVQHLSIFSDDVSHVHEDASKYKKLRTLMIRPKLTPRGSVIRMIDARFVGHLLSYMTCLRVLVLTDCGMEELPESIGNLKHLRLLDLSFNYYLAKLPESVGLLHNLLVLNLHLCESLPCLPSTLSRLVNLRYLENSAGLPVKGIGRLVSLRSDLYFTLQQESGFYIDQLKCLNELHGYLEISRLDLVRCQEDAKEARLDKKAHLKDLTLEWSEDSLPLETVLRAEEVLEALKPCQLLKKVRIVNYSGRKPPSGCTPC